MRLCCHGIYPRRAGDLYPKQQVSAVCVGYEVYYVYARYKKNEEKKIKRALTNRRSRGPCRTDDAMVDDDPV